MLATNAPGARRDRGGSLPISPHTAEIGDISDPTITAAARTGAYRSGPQRFTAVTVTDTGCGMSADVIAHIFEPFFTTKAEGKGTGLGMSMVYRLMAQMGGHVTVETEVGR